MGTSRRFDKTPLSSAELVELLLRRGLSINEPEVAAEVIFRIGYYRLAPYCRPFETQGHQFRPGTSLRDILDLYAFDRKLRRHFLGALARIEIAFRSALSEIMCQADSDAHWYLHPTHFADYNDYKVLVGNVERACEHPFPALQRYLDHYDQPELPPSWLMVEALSIGQLARVYKSLKYAKHRRAIAAALGLTEPVLRSWLDVLVRLRNLCAHHERLWDSTLEQAPVAPGHDWPVERDSVALYAAAVAIQWLLNHIAPTSPWAAELAALTAGREIELAGMGFPHDWVEQPFWVAAVAEADPESF